ncbi:hypothetical protein HID58_060343 [Brassica napus]|uniref:Telomere repeat-binding protein 1-6-like ubiquitin-like domain-containing protein n=1 Tax=Brassica napus TaxID=3708 RepID=A0ABQ7ZVI3_BRANA|nr:hypothetical protein HID58_060343 [Brassica napus]
MENKVLNGVSSAAVGLHCIGPVDKSHNLFDPDDLSTVMAAVTSLLSDGIHIGVLVRGKKARDENKSTTLYHRVVVRVEKIQAT